MNIDYLVTQDEDGIYCATVPALPGCFTDGKTLAELERNLRVAVQGVLESYAMLPPGADPLAVPETQMPGAKVKSLTLRFATPAKRHARRRPRRETALV